MIDITEPIYKKQGVKVKPGLKPSDLYTNKFIKPGIGL